MKSFPDKDNKWPISGKLVSAGDVFGRLTVQRVMREKARIRLLCQCKCGTRILVQARHVVNGRTQSCGCFAAEQSKTRNSILRRKPLGTASFNNLYGQYRSTAKKFAHEFALTKNQFRELTQKNCRYCGTPPSAEHCAGYGAYRYNGIDRADNEKGYTVENSVPCCYFCNRAKSKRSAEEYKEWLLAAARFILLKKPRQTVSKRVRYFKSHKERKTATALTVAVNN